jgi:hypothetical protein
MPAAGDPDARFVAINETFTAIVESLRLLADRFDAIAQPQSDDPPASR